MMRLGELLTVDHVHLPLEVDSVAEGLLRLLPLDATVEREVPEGESLLRRLQAGEGGFARRVSPEVVLFSLRGGENDPPWASIGLASAPIPGLGETSETEDGPTVLFVLRMPRIPAFGTGATEALVRTLQAPAVHTELLGSRSVSDVRGIEALVELDLAQPLQVKHALTPLKYRVFPETPMSEVLELMARRELRSLAVVGEDLEVLGVITGAEALRQALDQVGRGPGQEGASHAMARDVMSRSVMCVSEDQDLIEAAQLMAKRDVSQLPVVKEGEIIGVLTRNDVLKAVMDTR